MKFEKEDLENLLKLLSYEEHGLEKADFNKEVDPVLAQKCVDSWQACFHLDANNRVLSIEVPNIMKAYTSTITFASPDLVKWLIKVSDPTVTNTNNIKICLGIYTADMATAYPGSGIKQGRLTAFLWPYKDKDPATFVNKEHINPGPVPPYNIGSLYP